MENIAETYYSQGEFLSNCGKVEEALAVYNKAIELNSQYSEAYFSRGVLKYNHFIFSNSRTLYDEKVRDLELLIDNADKDSDIYYYLNRKIEILKQNEDIMIKSIQLLEDFEVAIKIEPKPVYHFWHGLIYFRIGGFEVDAILDYSNAISLNPHLVEAFYYRAKALYKLFRIKDALNDCNKALELDPDYHSVLEEKNSCEQILANMKRSRSYESHVKNWDLSAKFIVWAENWIRTHSNNSALQLSSFP